MEAKLKRDRSVEDIMVKMELLVSLEGVLYNIALYNFIQACTLKQYQRVNFMNS